MSRAMERIKKKREKNKENEINKKDNSLFKSAKIKNLVNMLEEQMGEKGIELGGKEKNNEINNNNNIIKEENNINNNINENETKIIKNKNIIIILKKERLYDNL